LFKVFLTEAKVNKILSLCAQIITSKTITTRKLSSFIGLCVHAFNAITLAPLHYRSLERDTIKNLAVYNGDYDSPITLSQESTTEVIWWYENVVKLNGKSIRKVPFDFFIETDASKNDWGAYFNGKFAGGRWSSLESTNHINFFICYFPSFEDFFLIKYNVPSHWY